MRLDFDGKFQESLVRLLYQDKSFAEAALPHLKPSVFESSMHQWVIKTMRQSLANQGVLPDLLMLRNERRKAEQLGVIRKEDASAYRAFLAKKILRPVTTSTYIKRELQVFVKHQALKTFILDAVDNHLPRHEFDVIDQKLNDFLHVDITGDYSLGIRPGATYEDRIKERKLPKEKGVTTGIAELDRLMDNNGCKEKQLGTVIAPTGRGKTNFLINLAAEAVMNKVPTLYITLELDEQTIMNRMDARFTCVPMRNLVTNEDDVRKGYANKRKRVNNNLVVKGFPPGSTTVAMIRAHIRKLQRIGFGPRLLVVDYADLLKPRIEFADSSYETQGQVYLDLLSLLAEERMVGWTATQGNRKSMDADTKGDVDLSMMADSVKKAFLAFVVLGIAQSEKEKKFGKGRIMVLKNRNGPSDRTLKVAIDHHICRFRSIT